MELKVWCEGIPRVVCGASATTTCQDVVFALAHATGQVGRFILIEKWRHCERVLAPNDRPLASLLKFGEYAADVTFVMKKSGEVSTASSNSNSNSAQNNGGKVNNGSGGGGSQRTTLLLNSGGGKKPSDSELHHHQQQRKVLQNSDQNVPPSQPQLQSVMSTSKSAGALSAYQNNNSNYSATLPHRGHRPEPFVRSISFHKPAELQLANGGEVILTSSTSHHPNHHHTYSMSNSNRSGVNYVPVSGVNGRTGVYHPQQETKHEPIYSTKAGAQNNSSRPPQPPPYQEAITKSSLFNGGNNSNSNSNSNPSSNGIYGYIGGNTAKQQQLNSSQQQQQQQTNGLAYQQQQHYQNKQQQQQQPTPLHEHQRMNMMNSNGTSKNHHLSKNHLSYLQQETRSIIDAQQQTIKKQEKDMVTIDQELNAVQRRLSANERVVAQYRAEMDYLHEIWLDQEALLGRLEAENLEEELERLITEAKAYEDELAEVRSRLTTCEADIARSREQISSLMVQVDEAAKAKDKERKKEEDKSENEQQQQAKLYSSLQKSILEKTKEIESQKLDLNLLCASIERLDQTIQDKNGIIDQLVVEIKDANVEGLSLSGALKGSSAGDGLTVRLDESHPQNQKSQHSSNHQMLMQNPLNSTTSANSSSTRKISVLPSELGNTVPTKKNPDGIWV